MTISFKGLLVSLLKIVIKLFSIFMITCKLSIILVKLELTSLSDISDILISNNDFESVCNISSRNLFSDILA